MNKQARKLQQTVYWKLQLENCLTCILPTKMSNAIHSSTGNLSRLTRQLPAWLSPNFVLFWPCVTKVSIHYKCFNLPCQPSMSLISLQYDVPPMINAFYIELTSPWWTPVHETWLSAKAVLYKVSPRGGEMICPPPIAVRRWQKLRWIHVRPRTGPESAHLW